MVEAVLPAMKWVNVLRYTGWALFLAGAYIVNFQVEGGFPQAVKSPTGWIGIACLLLGIVFTLVSTVIRLWPRRPVAREDDETH
jgi:uncharacterized membrane protein YhdT